MNWVLFFFSLSRNPLMAQSPNPKTAAAENSPAASTTANQKKTVTPDAENSSVSSPNVAQKKAKTFAKPALSPVQYRTVRFVSFMLEDSKYEVSPTDFIKEAVARHLSFYQIKRGIEFPNKMLAELGKLELIPSKSGSDD